jgi:predicted AAA+ superfamily ATPase
MIWKNSIHRRAGLCKLSTALTICTKVETDIYFWRDSAGTEVDVVYEDGPKVKAIEIKSGKTFAPEFAKGLESWMRYSGAKPADCALAYAGGQSMKWKDIAPVPWASVGE